MDPPLEHVAMWPRRRCRACVHQKLLDVPAYLPLPGELPQTMNRLLHSAGKTRRTGYFQWTHGDFSRK